jgi:hypothetical protein
VTDWVRVDVGPTSGGSIASWTCPECGVSRTLVNDDGHQALRNGLSHWNNKHRKEKS